MIIRTTV